MKILLISNAFNGLTQRVWLEMRRLGHQVIFESASKGQEKHLIRQYQYWKPDHVLCPFLTMATPPEIPALINHPGPRGDRGYSSLDWCLLKRLRTFGSTLLVAEAEMDAGPVHTHTTYIVPWQQRYMQAQRKLTKSSLYRRESTEAAVRLIKQWLYNISLEPPLEPVRWLPHELPPMERGMTQADCAIDFTTQTADEIVHRIRCRDGQPGVLTSQLIPGQRVFVYGAHLESGVHCETPGRILAHRDDALLISAAGNTSLWITHAKLQLNKQQLTCIMNAPAYKLPALYLLPPAMRVTLDEDVRPELFGSFELSASKRQVETWREIWYEVQDNVCRLYFEFYNGAMNTKQCRRLYAALREVATLEQVQVVVLMGGYDSFSNGIHLNTIEHATDPAQESWNNIVAMNQVVKQIMEMPAHQTTVTWFRASSGAGGTMLGLASDYVYASPGVVFNAHYASMGLFGSEYWTYNLPRRVGAEKAYQLTHECVPLSVEEAVEIGMIDGIADEKTMPAILESILGSWSQDTVTKQSRLSNPEWQQKVQDAGEYELAQMWENFHDPAYHRARNQFVYKAVTPYTPWTLQRMNARAAGYAAQMSGRDIARRMRDQLKADIESVSMSHGRIPCFAVVQVGRRADSDLFIREKLRAATAVGIQLIHIRLYDSDTKTLSHTTQEQEEEIIARIRQLNSDRDVDGIVLQLPLPNKELNTAHIVDQIALEKDIDGLRWTHPDSRYMPCAVEAIRRLLSEYQVKVRGVHVLIVGASHLLGMPLSRVLKQQHATVTVCDIHTPQLVLNSLLQQADIVISAVGKPGLIRHVRAGACVIDAGIMVENRASDSASITTVTASTKSHVHGDVDFDSIRSAASLVTPVPGGVGPITVGILLQHAWHAFRTNP